MNCEIFHLRELDVEPYQIREVLRCILHTIMFNRALGLVRPRDVDSELFDLTYVQCGDVKFEKEMEEKIGQLIGWVEKHPNKKSTVCLSFYETRKQNAWFGHKMERLYWEQWYITLNTTVQQSHLRSKSHHDKLADALDLMTDERSKRHTLLESGLKEVMLQILQQVNEKKDHVPPVTKSDVVVSFPYEISIPSSSDSSFGMDMFKRMLQTGPPPMLG